MQNLITLLKKKKKYFGIVKEGRNVTPMIFDIFLDYLGK